MACLAFLAFALAAATLYLLLSCLILPFVFDGLWAMPLLFLPTSLGTGWMAGYFGLMLVRMVSRITVGAEGVTLLWPLCKAKRCPWSEFQQVCICYSSAVPGKNDGVSVICFVRHGERRNRYDRWKADNAWHCLRIIAADHTAEIEEVVRAVCPMKVEDLRRTTAYPLQ